MLNFLTVPWCFLAQAEDPTSGEGLFGPAAFIVAIIVVLSAVGGYRWFQEFKLKRMKRREMQNTMRRRDRPRPMRTLD